MSYEPTVGALLERDHREIDARFAAFVEELANGRVQRAELQAASEALRHHIWVEEELHFPPLRAAGLLGPVLAMLREHGEIWDLLDRIEAQHTEDGDTAGLAQLLRHLNTVLDEHNFKEERILYPAGDAQFDDDMSMTVRAALTSGERPHGWVCDMAGRSS